MWSDRLEKLNLNVYANIWAQQNYSTNEES